MNDVDFASYADEVIFKLQSASKTLFQWFADNEMKANPDKCHFICSSNLKTSIMIKINKNIIVLAKNCYVCFSTVN